MATLLFKYPNAAIGALELDASVTEGHEGEVEVTEHPVEVGANVSDHARIKPDTLTLEGVISATPFGKTPSLDYIRAGYEKLLELKDARELLTVVTVLRSYPDMMLTKLSVPRDSTSGDALRFTATFKQVRLATVQKQTSTVRVARKVPKAKGKTELGNQVAPPTEEVRSSVWQQGVDYVSADKRLNLKPLFPGGR